MLHILRYCIHTYVYIDASVNYTSIRSDNDLLVPSHCLTNARLSLIGP